MCSIHHLSFDKNIRQGKIAIIHYDRGNILSGNFRREKSGGGIARLGKCPLGSVHRESVSRKSVLR